MVAPRIEDPAQLQRLVKEVRYDIAAGVLHWASGGKGRRHSEVGTRCRNGNGIRITFEGRKFLAHRVIWYIVHGEIPPNGVAIDHIDGDPSNNRMNNLRLATPAQNRVNSKLSRNNTSGTQGVSFNKHNNKWRATIKHEGQTKFLGYFHSKELAIEARIKAELELFGEFSPYAT